MPTYVASWMTTRLHATGCNPVHHRRSRAPDPEQFCTFPCLLATANWVEPIICTVSLTCTMSQQHFAYRDVDSLYKVTWRPIHSSTFSYCSFTVHCVLITNHYYRQSKAGLSELSRAQWPLFPCWAAPHPLLIHPTHAGNATKNSTFFSLGPENVITAVCRHDLHLYDLPWCCLS